jgi:hypothetical protein
MKRSDRVIFLVSVTEFFLEELKKLMQYLSQDSRSSSRDSNPVPTTTILIWVFHGFLQSFPSTAGKVP